jgi:hypothetical protein
MKALKQSSFLQSSQNLASNWRRASSEVSLGKTGVGDAFEQPSFVSGSVGKAFAPFRVASTADAASVALA